MPARVRQANTSIDNSGGAANRSASIKSQPGRSPALMSAKRKPFCVLALLTLKMSHSNRVKSRMASTQMIGRLLAIKENLLSSVFQIYSYCKSAVPELIRIELIEMLVAKLGYVPPNHSKHLVG